jgi:hypothetical protein
MGFVVAVNNFGDTRSGGLAGPMGLFIIVLMAVSTVLLIRNMNKRLRRLPDSFPDPAAEARAAEIARLDAALQRPGAAPRGTGAADHASEVESSTPWIGATARRRPGFAAKTPNRIRLDSTLSRPQSRLVVCSLSAGTSTPLIRQALLRSAGLA